MLEIKKLNKPTKKPIKLILNEPVIPTKPSTNPPTETSTEPQKQDSELTRQQMANR